MKRRYVQTADPESFRLHDHVAWSGEGEDDLRRLAVAVFSQAASRRQRMLYVSENPEPRDLAALAGLDWLLESGALQMQSVEAAYSASPDREGRLAGFSALVDASLAEGYTGVCVVADNTRLAGGSENSYREWLEWEAMADRLQATRPLNGICYFDSRRIDPARLADVAAMHPVVSQSLPDTDFRLFRDNGRLRVIGELDTFAAERLERILSFAPSLTELEIDVSEAGLVNHRALLVLDRIGKNGRPIRVVGASDLTRRVWGLLEVRSPGLELL